MLTERGISFPKEPVNKDTLYGLLKEAVEPAVDTPKNSDAE